jgi:hypothetical protein
MATIIMDVVYGIQIQGMDDNYIKLALTALEVIVKTRVPGKFWIEFMPILKYVPSWVPGTTAVRFGEKWKHAVEDMVNVPYDAVKTGEVSISYIGALFLPQDNSLSDR